MTVVAREVEFYVGVCQFYRLCAAVNGMYEVSSASHCIERESAGVAEHVEYVLSLGIFLKQTAVFTLVNEEASLLSFQPVHVELQAVFQSSVVGAAPDDEAVLLSEFRFIWQSCLALVEDVLHPSVSNLYESLCNLVAVYVHAYAVCLHHSRLAVAVNNESRQVVALSVYQSVGVVFRVVGNADGKSHAQCLRQTLSPEIFIDVDVFKRQYSYSDASYLEVSYSDEVSVSGKHLHRVSLADVLVHLVDSS